MRHAVLAGETSRVVRTIVRVILVNVGTVSARQLVNGSFNYTVTREIYLKVRQMRSRGREVKDAVS